MIERNLGPVLRELATHYPVITVTGPRQSGKTTVCTMVFPDKPLVSLEPLDRRRYAREDPRGFLADHQSGAILDEVQNAPELLSYLQEEVDARPQPGRFVLTGSQHFGLSAAISQSLAGRTAVVHLLPPSLDELQRFPALPTSLIELLWTGAYPRIFDRRIPAHRWLADYVTTYVQRDVRQVLAVNDLEAFTTFLRHCAGRTGQELNLSQLGADAGVSHNTARSWLSVLEASYICFRLPAWHRNFRKRLVKTGKLHFFDSGLACHLLGIEEPQALRHHPLRGAIFESWVAAEIYKARAHAGKPAAMFHYREVQGPEVDIVIETSRTLLLVEAKSGATMAEDFFAGLRALEERLVHKRERRVRRQVIIFGGDAAQRRSEVNVLPWSKIQDMSWV
jgi:predicted AAA+ superfamily ATPase